MKTSNLAIVFTDIKGFTARTSLQTHEENRRMLALHDALLTPVFKAFGGRQVKTIGDAFLVVFESPTQAVLCGVAIQDRLWDYNRRVAEPEQIHVRVAINMGEVRVEKGDVFGEPVNIAARVEGLADAGEVLFTEAVYLAMNKAEVPSEDRGHHELKGIPEKIRVYRVPQGAYRLGVQPPAEPAPPADAAPRPPYGGLALERIASLPAPDPAVLLAGNALRERSAALALGAAKGAQGLLSRLGALWRGLPPRQRLAALGAAAVVLALAVALPCLWSNPVESALSDGDLKRAEAELRKLKPGPWREYLDGRIEEEKKDWSDAARHFEAAARGGESRGFHRLVRLTRADSCSARVHAALALGRLRDRSALSALRTLELGRFEDEQSDNPLRQVFGCNSRRAAGEAIRAIEEREGR